MSSWYAVQTHPRAEARAALHLGNQGFPVFFPRYLRTRMHARRTDCVEAPLFPGYIFVALDLAIDRWRAVMSTLGVQRLVTTGERPSPVPDNVMDEMQSRVGDNGMIRLEDETIPFKCGDALTITDGPFKNYTGIFSERDDQRRIFLMLELLGRTLRIPIAVQSVQPVG